METKDAGALDELGVPEVEAEQAANIKARNAIAPNGSATAANMIPVILQSRALFAYTSMRAVCAPPRRCDCNASQVKA